MKQSMGKCCARFTQRKRKGCLKTNGKKENEDGRATEARRRDVIQIWGLWWRWVAEGQRSGLMS